MDKPVSESKRLRRKQLLGMLKVEEALVSTRGFRGSAETRTLYFEPFRDSVTCLNFSRECLHSSGEILGCEQCWLMEFVPHDHDQNAPSCRQILMNQEGETVASLESRGDIDRLEQAVLAWLRSKISQLELEGREDV